jgi:hypothetical protein
LLLNQITDQSHLLDVLFHFDDHMISNQIVVFSRSPVAKEV